MTKEWWGFWLANQPCFISLYSHRLIWALAQPKEIANVQKLSFNCISWKETKSKPHKRSDILDWGRSGAVLNNRYIFSGSVATPLLLTTYRPRKLASSWNTWHALGDDVSLASLRQMKTGSSLARTSSNDCAWIQSSHLNKQDILPTVSKQYSVHQLAARRSLGQCTICMALRRTDRILSQ